MCGIYGFTSSIDISPLPGYYQHRGPNDFGVYRDKVLTVAHNRLSILDLSERGRQPVTSSNGNLVLVFNGEIYNHLALRVKHGLQIKSSSDTLTLLALIEKIGLSRTLLELQGMFAFALYEKDSSKVYLARDRFGEKPLMYFADGSDLAFASDVRFFEEVMFDRLNLATDTVENYLQYKFVPQEMCIYKELYKVAPGHFVELDLRSGTVVSTEYWSLYTVVQEAISAGPVRQNDVEREVFHSLRQSMLSDAKLVTWLSSGVDSSLMSILAKKCQKNIQALTIAFANSPLDESNDAASLAREFDIQHTIVNCGLSEVNTLLRDLGEAWDEPFGDISAVPTLLLMKSTNMLAAVGISGDGGDELFGGYNRHQFADKYIAGVLAMPLFARLPIIYLLYLMWRIYTRVHKSPAVDHNKRSRIKKLFSVLLSSDIKDYYKRTISTGLMDGSDNFKKDCAFKKVFEQASSLKLSNCDFIKYCDQKIYLTDNILVKSDRAAMWYSVEGRAPFLNHNLVEKSWRLSNNKLTKNKLLLKSYLKQIFPNRTKLKKKGFTPPLAEWLKTNTEIQNSFNTLSARWIAEKFDIKVSKMLSEHINGLQDNTEALWSLYMLIAWLNKRPHLINQKI